MRKFPFIPIAILLLLVVARSVTAQIDCESYKTARLGFEFPDLDKFTYEYYQGDMLVFTKVFQVSDNKILAEAYYENTYWLELYDSDLNLINKKDFPNPKEGFEPMGIIQLKDKIYQLSAITDETDHSNKNYKIVCNEINVENLSFGREIVLLNS